MELTESIESLNRQLVDEYGLDTSTNQPMFRIVWSDDQRENRMVDRIQGLQLIHPMMMVVPKYPYIHALYLLERLVNVPESDRKELGDIKLSYEPVWTFCDKKRDYLPPTWPAAKFVVDTLYAAIGKKSLAKYKQDESPEVAEERVRKIHEELFGNETEVGDALAHKTGVVVP